MVIALIIATIARIAGIDSYYYSKIIFVGLIISLILEFKEFWPRKGESKVYISILGCSIIFFTIAILK